VDGRARAQVAIAPGMIVIGRGLVPPQELEDRADLQGRL